MAGIETKLESKFKTHHCSWWKCANSEDSTGLGQEEFACSSLLRLLTARCTPDNNPKIRWSHAIMWLYIYQPALFPLKRRPYSSREKGEPRVCAVVQRPVHTHGRFSPPVRHWHRIPLGPPPPHPYIFNRAPAHV